MGFVHSMHEGIKWMDTASTPQWNHAHIPKSTQICSSEFVLFVWFQIWSQKRTHLDPFPLLLDDVSIKQSVQSRLADFSFLQILQANTASQWWASGWFYSQVWVLCFCQFVNFWFIYNLIYIQVSTTKSCVAEAAVLLHSLPDHPNNVSNLDYFFLIYKGLLLCA